MDFVTNLLHVIGLVVSIGTIVFVCWWNRRVLNMLEQKETEARLHDIEKISCIEWKPGTVLWVRLTGLRGYGEEGQKARDGLVRFFREAGVPDPAVLVTPEDTEIMTLSVVDLLALVGRTHTTTSSAGDEDADDDDKLGG